MLAGGAIFLSWSGRAGFATFSGLRGNQPALASAVRIH